MVFEKVFKEDIERLRSMEGMWNTRKPPEPLDYDKVSQEVLGVGSAIAQQDQIVWTLAENFAVFIDSLRRLSNRLEELRANGETGDAPPILTFDKDDMDTLDFVAASANLRSHIFSIETRSKFDIKRGSASTWFPLLLLTCSRNGGKHYPCDSNYECHDCRPLRTTSIQSDAG